MQNLQLKNKSILITNVDSLIGRAVALLFAKEGANIAIVLGNQKNGEETKNRVIALGCKSISFSGDMSDYEFCQSIIKKTASEFGRIDIIVNIGDIYSPSTKEVLIKTSYSNIVGTILLSKAALPYLKEGSSIINTTSAIVYPFSDYLPAKGAVTSFTLSLALQLKSKGIRVNAIALDPVISFNFLEECKNKNMNTILVESPVYLEHITTSFLFLATELSDQITGQVIYPNKKLMVNC